MQHEILPRPSAPRPVAIEVDGEPLGVVVPADEGYRFLAVRLSAVPIDGQTFESIEAARQALGAAVRPEIHD
jgi:hypothetical protein